MYKRAALYVTLTVGLFLPPISPRAGRTTWWSSSRSEGSRPSSTKMRWSESTRRTTPPLSRQVNSAAATCKHNLFHVSFQQWFEVDAAPLFHGRVCSRISLSSLFSHCCVLCFVACNGNCVWTAGTALKSSAPSDRPASVHGKAQLELCPLDLRKDAEWCVMNCIPLPLTCAFRTHFCCPAHFLLRYGVVFTQTRERLLAEANEEIRRSKNQMEGCKEGELRYLPCCCRRVRGALLARLCPSFDRCWVSRDISIGT